MSDEIEVKLPSELLLLLRDPLMGPAVKQAVDVIRELIIKLAEAKRDAQAMLGAGDRLSQAILNAQGDNPSEAAKAAWPSNGRQMGVAKDWLEAARNPRIRIYGSDEDRARLREQESSGSGE